MPIFMFRVSRGACRVAQLTAFGLPGRKQMQDTSGQREVGAVKARKTATFNRSDQTQRVPLASQVVVCERQARELLQPTLIRSVRAGVAIREMSQLPKA